MKTRMMVLLMVLVSAALLAACATSGKLDPNTVRTDDLSLWDEAGWSELTPAEQALWKILGWDEASWEGEAAQPASEDKYWFGLSEEERAAAEKLGYTKESWDE